MFGPKKKSLTNTCALLCGSGHLPAKEHARGQLRTTRTLGTFASVFSPLRLEGHIPHRLCRGLWPRGGDSDRDRWMLPSEFCTLMLALASLPLTSDMLLLFLSHFCSFLFYSCVQIPW